MKGVLIIVPLILVIVLGMVLKAKRFLVAEDRERLTHLLYWIVLPALLFRTIYMAAGDLSQQGNLFLAAYVPFLIVPLFGLTAALIRYPGDRGMHALCAMCSSRANNVYLGLPAAILALGEPGAQAASVYLAIALPGYNLISILWGEAILSGGLSPRTLAKMAVRVLRNPLIASALLGLIAAQVRLPVPDSILVSLKLVGDMATGIALISLGMSLDLSSLPRAFKRTWPDVLIKLIVHPAVVWLCLLVWPVSETIFQVSIIICSMPTAVNTFIVAGGMGLDAEYTCEIIAVSTILAPVTIPIWVALLGIA